MLSCLSSPSSLKCRELIYYFGNVHGNEEAYNEKLVPSGVVVFSDFVLGSCWQHPKLLLFPHFFARYACFLLALVLARPPSTHSSEKLRRG